DLELEIHSDHELVRTGPYRFVRHPVYTGLGLHFAGACLATGNLLLIAGTLLVTYPALYLRAVTEERRFLLRGARGRDPRCGGPRRVHANGGKPSPSRAARAGADRADRDGQSRAP